MNAGMSTIPIWSVNEQESNNPANGPRAAPREAEEETDESETEARQEDRSRAQGAIQLRRALDGLYIAVFIAAMGSGAWFIWRLMWT